MIADIFDGKVLNVWVDEECWFFSFPYCTVMVPKEGMDDLFEDFLELAEKIKERDF